MESFVTIKNFPAYLEGHDAFNALHGKLQEMRAEYENPIKLLEKLQQARNGKLSLNSVLSRIISERQHLAHLLYLYHEEREEGAHWCADAVPKASRTASIRDHTAHPKIERRLRQGMLDLSSWSSLEPLETVVISEITTLLTQFADIERLLGRPQFNPGLQ